MTSAGYERQAKENSESKLFLPMCIYLVVFHTQNENTVVASNWSQITFFILANVVTSISERFWPNFDQINIPPPLAAILFGKDGLQRTTRGSSKCYWLLKFLLLPYTCNGIKDAHKNLRNTINIS